MTPRDRNIISDSNIAFTSTSYLDALAVCNIVCVNNIKYFLTFRRKRLENDIVLAWAVNFNDVDDLVVVCNLEWKVYFAQFTVKLLKFDY